MSVEGSLGQEEWAREGAELFGLSQPRWRWDSDSLSLRPLPRQPGRCHRAWVRRLGRPRGSG